eukprot:CAMPEP_0183432696 /NCGR_PEP_ID=MMETSP0370-20130417/59068_1 /TAXON_ID=268820 /ORGANISM="Peridinium aciculiferum, Strain PAER-2" /LENGTH=47 /DNA_ID= /DNA_START= /DNA_END= /DNA_ORIENTATION=
MSGVWATGAYGTTEERWLIESKGWDLQPKTLKVPGCDEIIRPKYMRC